ncbi:MAG: DegT/DnrJ/EryC1/StrS family aminotransferase [Gammaproteobacteria bacterium]|nr:DegT/DnrJ/EryC1/StrS family aminotransferase [Gammaproteobacteria bacterium]
MDLSQQFRSVEEEWLASIRQTGATGQFILGPNVAALEAEIAAYIGVPHAVAVANGTDALLLSLRALGIGPGDEVITTPFTFFASAEVITHVGATPVFVDICRDTYNIDPDLIEDVITERSKAIMPVHLFGCPADMTRIEAIANTYELKVVEDAAQAFGAKWRQSVVGSIGDVGCFSFYPTKVLGCYGDGGMVVCQEQSMVERLRSLRNHGATASYVHNQAGYNSRLDEIQASLLRIKLRGIDADIASRQHVAKRYDTLLHDTGVGTPPWPNECQHVFNLYTVRIQQRERVRQFLREADIGCSVYYPVPLHLQEVYRGLNLERGSLPVSEQVADEVLSLPIFPEMSDNQIDMVCEKIESALQ